MLNGNAELKLVASKDPAVREQLEALAGNLTQRLEEAHDVIRRQREIIRLQSGA